MRLAALAATFALASLAACRPAAEAGAPPAAEAAASEDVHAFEVGELQAWALRDGGMALPVDTEMLPWSDRAAVAAALAAAGEAGDAVHLSIQPLLVRDGDRLVLIDTGGGSRMEAEGAGNLMASLAAAGFVPGDVTDILISHVHQDHIGGLVTAAGDLAFPNAVIRISAPEWAYLRERAGQAGETGLVDAIAPQVEAFEPGAQVSPSIRAMPLAGHTAGHSGFEVGAGEARLIYIGDALHSSLISVQHPGWANAWDVDAEAGVGTRVGLLEMGSDHDLLIYGVHFPYPGLGRFRREGGGFIWDPEHR